MLGDALVGGEVLGTDLDVDGVFLAQIAGQGLHRTGPRGGPQERLSVRTDLTADLADLGRMFFYSHRRRNSYYASITCFPPAAELVKKTLPDGSPLVPKNIHKRGS